MKGLRAFLRSRIERDLLVVERLIDDFATQEDVPPIAGPYLEVFSPGRIRAEAEQRLGLVDLHRTARGRELLGCCGADEDTSQCAVLRAMAVSYIDDEGFNMSWSVPQ